MTSPKDKQLDLNIPDDARIFITEALPTAFRDGVIPTHADLEDGTRIALNALSDSQAVQYAWELLPIYQAAFPELCEIIYEN